MIIYKFKDLTEKRKYSHFLQIILQNTIWCARPDSLNDDNEFKFKLDYSPSPNTANLLSQLVANHQIENHLPPELSTSLVLKNMELESLATPIIDEVIKKCRNTIGIISFSLTKTDHRLWEEYGGSGNGICIEINIPDRVVGHTYHRVHYVSDKIFHVDSFLESALFPERAFQTFQNILLTKVKKWSQEEEIRFIGKHQDVNMVFDGPITDVTFGSHVPENTFEQIMSNIADHCRAQNIRISKL
jgi:hypothetical protein